MQARTQTQRVSPEPMILQDALLGRLMLSAIGLIWYASLWIVSLVGWKAAYVPVPVCIAPLTHRCRRRRYRSRPRSPLATSPPDSVPGVSILRPLKGLDANLYENLESTFTQEYPKYEILMCVADAQDPALRVARDLLFKYPQVNARVVVGMLRSCMVSICSSRRAQAKKL